MAIFNSYVELPEGILDDSPNKSWPTIGNALVIFGIYCMY